MIRLWLTRKQVVGLSAFSLLLGSSFLVAPTPSYADPSWADLLKPLVRDVVVPGANAGMKKLLEKKLKLKLDGSNSSFDNSSNSFSNGFSGNDSMSMPEEPFYSSSGSGSGDDNVLSMPEEPTYSASSVSEPDGASLSSPPPPVNTP